ncbi:acetoacetate decarboxylase (plasmid) [Legionella adelaidensis]|uniref:Acetoacetate decarboxylase n=1 Tax=Legionella adelaidensis TaxID=45056 RepID=A0A0W0R1M0_9GAMM|nr:acetoacetate decarboxylase [Legionella adelaidensis]KTC64982.1 acetoacetate decarboxylase [Legionella adelaidensis]VEH85338.1 acetoacetate decarboxylase [Legionella adelaidensis]
MKESDVKNKAFAMPIYRPSYPPGPYRFINREFFIISYETDMDILKEVVPAPLEVTEPIVKFEFIRMPDSTGFGDYTESGQVIPVRFNGQPGSYSHAMYLDDLPPIAGGREIWGFPKKMASPCLRVEKETLLGTLDYDSCRIATATMGYKYRSLDQKKIAESMAGKNYLLKIIPHVDGSVRICELVEYQLTDINVKGAWDGPAAIELFQHAMAPVADLPVKRVISAIHIQSDLTLPYGRVVHDYLK